MRHLHPLAPYARTGVVPVQVLLRGVYTELVEVLAMTDSDQQSKYRVNS